MPPKEVQTLRPQVNGSPHLPSGDIDFFFRVLRFISTYPQLATLNTATNCANAATCRSSTTQAVSVVGDNLPSHSQSTTTGASASVSNRIATPPVLQEPLETFRMMATNLPTDQQGLDAARNTVCRLLKDLCAELGDPAITEGLNQLLLTGKRELPRSPDNRDRAGSSAGERSVSRIPSSFALNNFSQMQEIVPGLWCGSYHPATDRELMRSHGITHVCCCIGTQPRFPGDFIYFTFSADDRPDYDMTPHFAATFEFIENALVKTRGGVLVHCGAGISRAPTVVSAYLMRKLRLSSSAAIGLVQSHRSCASPNIGFRQQLHSYGMQIGVNEESTGVRRRLASESFSRAVGALRSR